MAGRTSQRSSRLTSRKDMATPDMGEDLEPQGEQEDELALDAVEEDEEDDAQAVVPVEERGVTSAAGTTSVSRRGADHWLLYIPNGYLRNSIAELLKVTWTSRQETINLTILVLAIAAGFAIVYGLLDIVFFDGLNAIIQHVK